MTLKGKRRPEFIFLHQPLIGRKLTPKRDLTLSKKGSWDLGSRQQPGERVPRALGEQCRTATPLQPSRSESFPSAQPGAKLLTHIFWVSL